MAQKRPNLVIFNPDHYRGEAMGHAGNPCVHTPQLDALVANDAVSFQNCFCQSPVCTPSRCSFMSGLYPHVHGHRTMFHMLQPHEPMLLRQLKEAGYQVWWGGKNDVVPAQHGFADYCDIKYQPKKPVKADLHTTDDWRGPVGGDRYFSFFKGKLEMDDDESVYHDSDWANVLGAIEHLGDSSLSGPFCLYLPLYYPHPPLAVEEPFFSAVEREQVPGRIPTPDDWSGKASMLAGIFDRSGMANWTEERWTELRAVYYGMCARIDHQFGLVVNALRQAGVYDDTAIFFFSDHGMYLGDYGLVTINQNTFEDVLTRVPLVIKPPRDMDIEPGSRDGLVELTDVVATVIDMLELDWPHSHFGQSLRPQLNDSSHDGRDAVFSEGGRLADETHCMELEYAPGHQDPLDLYYPRLSLQAEDHVAHGKAVMCRTATHKYVQRLYEQDELYDLTSDPQELENRIDDPTLADVRQSMQARLARFFLETADTVPLTPDTR